MSKIRVTMDTSPEFKALLERLKQQQENPTEQSDIIRRAIALYEAALAEKRKREADAPNHHPPKE